MESESSEIHFFEKERVLKSGKKIKNSIRGQKRDNKQHIPNFPNRIEEEVKVHYETDLDKKRQKVNFPKHKLSINTKKAVSLSHSARTVLTNKRNQTNQRNTKTIC